MSASSDNTLIESPTGALSNGSGPAFFVGLTSQSVGARRRGLILFDVASALPPGAVVTAVELQLDLEPSNPTPIEIELHRVLAPWGEGASESGGGSGAPSAPGDATWIHTFYDQEFWASPGGDFAQAASATATVGDAGLYAWPSSAELVADVQRWLDDPSSNHGWLLLSGEDVATSSKRFASREAEEPEAAPRLLVDYELPCTQLDLDAAAHALCHVYCETLNCDDPNPRASPRACAQAARLFALRGGIAGPICEPDRSRRD